MKEAQLTRTSLRSRLVRHVSLPLLLTWAAGAALALSIASYFTQRAFDRAMLDDAYLLAAHLEARSGELVLNMGPDDVRTVLFDQSESVYFSITGARGQLVAGHPGLHPPPSDEAADSRYFDMAYQGQALRAVVLRRKQPQPVEIIVALTTNSRRALLKQLVIFSVAPQALLLLALMLWVHRVVSRDLRPLSHLQELVERRDAADLSPLPAHLTGVDASRDVHGLAQSIDALLRRVEQSVAAQREFAGNVAHELRTPLAGIRASADYALAHAEPARWREALRSVKQSQMRASRLVDQLLALALADEGGDAVRLVTLDLSACAREQLLHFLPRADQAGVTLEAVGLDDPTPVMADPALLEGLLTNLIDNALRYGHSPTQPGKVWIELDRSDAASVSLRVCDQGPGMSAEQREGLLKRWRQGPSGTALGIGAGLGLAIVQRYATLMNADFSLAPGKDGAGLQASVVFPVLR